MIAPTLCVADVDQDSTVVEYIGHDVVFSDPVLVAALASPPYYDDKSQYIDSSYTRYGKTSGGDVTNGATIGFSLGRSIGAKAEIPVISNGEIEAKVTATVSYDFGFSVGVSYEYSVSYDNYAGDDAVIFTALPMDVYFYRVTSADTVNKAQPAEGDIVSIKVLRENKLYFTSTEFYNAHNGSYPDVGSTVFSHTIGNPYSYTTRDAAKKRVNSDIGQSLMLAGTTGIVPEGERYNTISYSSALTLGGSFNFSAELTREINLSFLILAGTTESARVGYSLEISNTTGTLFEGSVGGLESEDFSAAAAFNWGIYSYVQSVDDNPLTVINYWVE